MTVDFCFTILPVLYYQCVNMSKNSGPSSVV